MLYEHGHARIGFIRNEPQNDYDEMKTKVTMEELKRLGVALTKNNIFSSKICSWENSLSAAQSMTEKNIKLISTMKLTALIFTSAIGGVAAIKILKEHGISVPEDISVVGDGDYNIFEYLSPAMTVVNADYQKMVCEAVDFLVSPLLNTESHHYYDHTIIKRESLIQL